MIISDEIAINQQQQKQIQIILQEIKELYRIFFYDCKPLTKKLIIRFLKNP